MGFGKWLRSQQLAKEGGNGNNWKGSQARRTRGREETRTQACRAPVQSSEHESTLPPALGSRRVCWGAQALEMIWTRWKRDSESLGHRVPGFPLGVSLPHAQHTTPGDLPKWSIPQDPENVVGGWERRGSLAWTLCALLPSQQLQAAFLLGVPSYSEEKAGAESTRTLPSQHRWLPWEAPKPVNWPNNRAEAPASRSKDESHPLSGPRPRPCSLRTLALEELPRAEPGPARPGSAAPSHPPEPGTHKEPSVLPAASTPVCSCLVETALLVLTRVCGLKVEGNRIKERQLDATTQSQILRKYILFKTMRKWTRLLEIPVVKSSDH